MDLRIKFLFKPLVKSLALLIVFLFGLSAFAQDTAKIIDSDDVVSLSTKFKAIDWQNILALPFQFKELRTSQDIPQDFRVTRRNGDVVDISSNELFTLQFSSKGADRAVDISESAQTLYSNYRVLHEPKKLLPNPRQGIRFYILSKDWCGYCHIALGRLALRFGNKAGFEIVDLNLTHKEGMFEFGNDEEAFDAKLPYIAQLLRTKSIYLGYPTLIIQSPSGFLKLDRASDLLVNLVKTNPPVYPKKVPATEVPNF